MGDIRDNWIEDFDSFKTSAETLHQQQPYQYVDLHVIDNEPQPRGRTENRCVELVVVGGPTWNLFNGHTAMANSYKSDKLPWNEYMAGPSSKLAAVLEFEDFPVCNQEFLPKKRWTCPLCPAKSDINEEGGRSHCPSVTFGGILQSHIRGFPHRQSVYWAQHQGVDMVQEFPLGSCSSYFFNWLSGEQGFRREDAAGPPQPLPQEGSQVYMTDPWLQDEQEPHCDVQPVSGLASSSSSLPPPPPPGPPPDVSSQPPPPPGQPSDESLSGDEGAPEPEECLPEWTRGTSNNGEVFWFQYVSGARFWVKTGAPDLDPASVRVWTAYQANDGSKWWYNDVTEEFFFEDTGTCDPPGMDCVDQA